MKYLNKITTLCTAALLVLFMAASPALAQEQNFDSWDEDGDGNLAETEFATMLGDIEYIHHWDNDNDGRINPPEWEITVNNHLSETHTQGDYGSFGEWDQDGNRLLSEEEFQTGLLRTLDEDGNRMISQEEFDTWYREDESQ